MCEKAVKEHPCTLGHVPDNLKMQEMCDKAVDHNPYMLKDLPYRLKTEKMCKKVVQKMPYYLGQACPWSFQDKRDVQQGSGHTTIQPKTYTRRLF